MDFICPECKSINTSDSKSCVSCKIRFTKDMADLDSSTFEIANPSQSSLSVGRIFAERYLILELLGEGGMGKVYRVRDNKLDEEIALKVLKNEIVSNKTVIERFRRELKLARKITHKNICRVYDFHWQDNIPFITMEFISGENLGNFIKKAGQITIKETLEIVRQVLEGLNEAHNLGVVHRDLKPQNIMIDGNRTAKIMDFGIARSIDAQHLTQSGVIFGTPAYISPEQADGKIADQQSDIYSLGIIIYEMVTGKLPFKGDTPLSIALKHKIEIPQDPQKINPEVSSLLNRLILTCLKKEKSKRYKCTNDILSDLKTLNGEKNFQLTTKFPQSHGINKRKTFWILGTIIALIAIMSFLFLKIFNRPPSTQKTPKPSLAIVYFENNTGDKNLDHWRKTLSEMLIADLSQSKLIKVLPGDQLYQILNDLKQLDVSSYSANILKEIASRGRASHIIRGSFSKAGKSFRINTMLKGKDNQDIISSDWVEGEGIKSFFPMIDKLTIIIKSKFNLSAKDLESDIDREVETITTSSAEAMKFFSEGVKYLYQAKYHQSIKFLKKAVEEDPEFAGAYLWLAFAYQSIGLAADLNISIQKAYDHKDRVSKKNYYLILGAYYGFYKLNYKKAISSLKDMLKLYPDSVYGNNLIAFLYYYIEEYDLAHKHYKRNYRNKARIFYTYYMLARTYMVRGDYEQARIVIEEYIKNVTDHLELRFILAVNYFCQGNYKEALKNALRSSELGLKKFRWWDFWIQGAIYQSKGDLKTAELKYRDILKLKDMIAKLIGGDSLSSLYLHKGKYKRAVNLIRETINLNKGLKADKTFLYKHHTYLIYLLLSYGTPQDALSEYNKIWGKLSSIDYKQLNPGFALYLQGLIYIRLDQIAKAVSISESLKDLVQRKQGKKDRRDYLLLSGEIAVKRGDLKDAIFKFTEAKSLLPFQTQDDMEGIIHRTLYLSSLANAYYRSKYLKKAEEEYTEILQLTIGRLNYGDIYAKSLYMLGKINEQLGKKKKSLEYFRQFLNLWKDADPGIPEVEDARKRLSLNK